MDNKINSRFNKSSFTSNTAENLKATQAVIADKSKLDANKRMHSVRASKYNDAMFGSPPSVIMGVAMGLVQIVRHGSGSKGGKSSLYADRIIRMLGKETQPGPDGPFQALGDEVVTSLHGVEEAYNELLRTSKHTVPGLSQNHDWLLMEGMALRVVLSSFKAAMHSLQAASTSSEEIFSASLKMAYVDLGEAMAIHETSAGILATLHVKCEKL